MSYKHTEINDIDYYGKHLILDVKGCNYAVLQIQSIKDFIGIIVQKINMVPYGGIVIDRFGEGDDIGISAVQLIMTSSITIHTNDLSRDMYLDIFSCKWFDERIIVRILNTLFSPVSYNMQILLRG